MLSGCLWVNSWSISFHFLLQQHQPTVLYAEYIQHKVPMKVEQITSEYDSKENGRRTRKENFLFFVLEGGKNLLAKVYSS